MKVFDSLMKQDNPDLVTDIFKGVKAEQAFGRDAQNEAVEVKHARIE